jgi:PAS domain S-box-containing protein
MTVSDRGAESQLQLQAVFASLQEGVIIADAQGMLLSWNEAALRMHGFSREADAKKAFSEIASKFELQTLDRKRLTLDQWPLPRVLRGESFSACDLRVHRTDLDLDRVFSYSGTPVYQNGQLTLGVLTCQDVTERARAEEALRRSEADLRDFVENASVGLHWVGPDGTILWANQTELDLLGYTREEYIGHHIAEFHADEPVIDDILNTLSSGNTLINREARLRCKDGSVRYVLINSNVLFDGGNFLRTRCFTRDITERKQFEEALQESAYRFSALADNIDQMAWMADETGFVYWFNRRWYEYTGTTPEIMEGHGWQSMIHPAVLPHAMQRWIESVQGGRPFDMEIPIRAADHSYRTFLTRVHAVRDETGKIVRWFGTNTDITEQKKAHEELSSIKDNLEQIVRQRTEDLLEANEQLEGFTYSVAHDFRAHIRGIIANAAMVVEDAGDKLDPESRNHLERLVAAAKQMNALTEDLLSYAKSGTSHVRQVDVNLTELAHEIRENMRGKPYWRPDTDLKVAEGLHVQGDPGLLRLALENLIDNACKYSHKSAHPVVELGRDEESFFVKDNGIGFDMKYAQKLFQPFERLNVGKDYEGTGIGLANVQRIIEKHGGRVWAESEPEAGSTFRFTLP